MKWFSKNAVWFSAKTCFAAFLSLYIALELNLDNPAWALTSVYVVSQYYSASTVSKSLFRLLGTVLGGLFTLFIYPLTIQEPVMFSLAMSLWVATCLYLSLHDRTPKSYVFMLAGYSATIMGFPDVTEPSRITFTVISRIEEIGVAIVCSSLIHCLVMPVSMRHLLENSVSQWYQNAQELCHDMVTSLDSEKTVERESILIQMTNNPLNVETLMTHCVYDGEAARRLVRLVSVQYRHLSYLIPTLTAIEARLSQLTQQNVQFPEYVAQAFQKFITWLDGDESLPVYDDLVTAQAQLKQAWEQGELSSEESILLVGLLERLLNFVRIAQGYHSASERVSEWTPKIQPGKTMSLSYRHIDKGLLLLSSFTAFFATFACCLFWLASSWENNTAAPMMAAVLCSFFAGADTPVTPMKLFLKGVIGSITISVLYIVLFIPQAINFESLIICLAPGLLILGLVIANPSTMLIGLIIATQIPAFIGMAHHFKPNLMLIISMSISTILGILFGVVVTSLIRNKRPSWIAKRAVRQGIRELLQFLSAMRLDHVTLPMRHQFVSRTLEKVNVILPRKRLDPVPDLVSGGNLLTEAWLGANCYDFYVRNQSLLAMNHIESDAMFHELNLFLKHRLKSLQTQPHDALLVELNRLLLQLESEAKQKHELFVPLFHLFNIRLSLFPQERWPGMTA